MIDVILWIMIAAMGVSIYILSIKVERLEQTVFDEPSTTEGAQAAKPIDKPSEVR